MNFLKSILEASVNIPEEEVLNHVFPFYECNNGTFAFFGLITKTDCRDQWIVTPLKSELISEGTDTYTYNVSNEASGKKYVRNSHSGRRLYIDKPDESNFKVSKAYKKLFDVPLYKADFNTAVRDMNNAVVERKVIIDGLL